MLLLLPSSSPPFRRGFFFTNNPIVFMDKSTTRRSGRGWISRVSSQRYVHSHTFEIIQVTPLKRKYTLLHVQDINLSRSCCCLSVFCLISRFWHTHFRHTHTGRVLCNNVCVCICVCVALWPCHHWEREVIQKVSRYTRKNIVLTQNSSQIMLSRGGRI